jgi:ParB-like chromosome segregation protein Spo0J
MQIEQIAVTALTEYAGNANTHDDIQVQQIADSIQEFGFLNPVLIDKNNELVAGHGRVMAAKLLGLKIVPCIRVGHLSERQKRAYVLADNKIARNSKFDFEKLSAEIDALVDVDFDINLLGFNEQELAALLTTDEGIFPDAVIATEKVPRVEVKTNVPESNDLPKNVKAKIVRECTCPSCGTKFEG